MEDLLIGWLATALDIGGQPANVQGYKIWDMTDPLNPVEAQNVPAPATAFLLVDFVTDPNNAPPIAVSAYNAQGDGARSATVIASAPAPSVPEAVQGVTAVVVPKP